MLAEIPGFRFAASGLRSLKSIMWDESLHAKLGFGTPRALQHVELSLTDVQPYSAPSPLIVEEVTNVEMLRDGGSYCADFRATDGIAYELRFPVVYRDVERTEASVIREFCGHQNPFVARLVKFGSIAEGQFGYSLEDERPVAWEEARRIMQQVRALANGLDEFRSRDLAAMIATAERDGRRAEDKEQYTKWYRPGHLPRENT